jgi:hypothetical protein
MLKNPSDKLIPSSYSKGRKIMINMNVSVQFSTKSEDLSTRIHKSRKKIKKKKSGIEKVKATRIFSKDFISLF